MDFEEPDLPATIASRVHSRPSTQHVLDSKSPVDDGVAAEAGLVQGVLDVLGESFKGLDEHEARKSLVFVGVRIAFSIEEPQPAVTVEENDRGEKVVSGMLLIRVVRPAITQFGGRCKDKSIDKFALLSSSQALTFSTAIVIDKEERKAQGRESIMDRLLLMTTITIYLSTRGKAVDIFDKGIPRKIGPNFRTVVLSGLATLVNTISYGLHMPRSFSDTVTWGYSYITAIDGRFGMEYALKEANEELEVAREGAPVIVHGGQACYPYSNMIQSGPKARRYSRLTPGSYLVSRNGLYMLVLGFDCNLELMEGNIVVWRPLISIGANRNCYLRVRLDGRVVFENESVCLWTIDSGVSGESVSSVLVLQNDRNLVLYRSDEQVAVWASNTVDLEKIPTASFGADLAALCTKPIREKMDVIDLKLWMPTFTAQWL
ncbi:hypothetical protein SELMODRAFT_408439 [Selaginella moellendorffii]|uniref:Bulb-type lectin domain-containing protein n=1 Tax=Selaginella moellendorffii TaxID=88036 RepID=D8R8A6_SELML|nr:hypothetical protein SELMODRAFT_408439 [Selaginella moellendorffii]